MLEFIAHLLRAPGPRKILVASDLTCRCDRALARVGCLAKAWNAWVIAAHVVARAREHAPENFIVPSWRQPPSSHALAEVQLRSDVSEACAAASVMVVDGDPPQEILKIASRHSVDLIVTGLTRTAFGGIGSGATLRSLMRRANAPVLVVKMKPRRPYAQIVVPVDFTAESVDAVTTAARLFPEAQLTLFHAFGIPGPGMAINQNGVVQFREQAKQQLAEFIGGHLSGSSVPPRAHIVAEHGNLASLIRDYVCARNIDLVVVGAPARWTLAELFVGRLSRRLVEAVSCDLMIVRSGVGR